MIKQFFEYLGFRKAKQISKRKPRASKNDKLYAVFDQTAIGQKRGMHITKKRATNAAHRYGKLHNKRITVSCKDGKVTFIRKW